MGRSGAHGHLSSTGWRKTGEFLIDLSRDVYKPKWRLQHKFGQNGAVPNGSWEPVTSLSTTYVFPQAPTTVRVKAGGDPADTLLGAGARTIRIQGLNSDATAEITEDIELAGASASASTTQTFWRVYRAQVLTTGSYTAPWNTANIIVENTAGTADLLQIDATWSQTQHLVYSLPTGTSAIVLGHETHVSSSQAADIRIMYRPNFTTVTAPFESARNIYIEHGILGNAENRPDAPFTPPIVGPCDFWMEARGSGGATAVSGEFQLFEYPTP